MVPSGPLGYLYFGLLRDAFRPNSFAWHSVALAIHLANCALLYFIVKTLWDRPPLARARCAAFRLAWHAPGSRRRGAPAISTSSLADSLSPPTLCALRRYAARAPRAFAVLAILSKESAYAAPLVILGFAAAGGKLREARIPSSPSPRSVSRCSSTVGRFSTAPAATSTQPPDRRRCSRFIWAARSKACCCACGR